MTAQKGYGIPPPDDLSSGGVISGTVEIENQLGAPITVEVVNTPLYITGSTQTGALTDEELRASDVEVNDSTLQSLIDVYKIPLGRSDPNQEHDAPFTSGEDWTGTFTAFAPIPGISTLVVMDSEPSLVEIQWSSDGVNPAGGLLGVTPITITPSMFGAIPVWVASYVSNIPVNNYYRLHVVNGAAAGTFFGSTRMWQLRAPFGGSFSTLNTDPNAYSTALLTRAVLAGEAPDDTFSNVGVTRSDQGQFALLTRDTGLDNNRTIFGALNTETPVADVTIDFSEPVLNLVSDTTANGGIASTADAQSVLSTGTNAAGIATRRTRIPVRYRPGSELRFDFTAVFTAGVADSEQHIGAMADNYLDGVYIGFDGATFGVTHRQNGVNTTIAQSSWNGDPLDGAPISRYTRDGVPEVWDPTKGNVYRIRLGWLGYSVIIFEVQSPDGNYVPLHTVRYPNTAVVPHLYQNDLEIWSHVANLGNTTDIQLKTASWRGGSMDRPRPQSRIIFQKTDSRDGTLPTGTAPTIDPVLNADANVFDSGWLPTFDHPGGNFLNIVGDTSLDVYLMNASSTGGFNIVGDGAPAIQTIAGVPATFAAPYFDDYYRVLIVNTSGSPLTSYTIMNRAHENAQQGLHIGLTQTVLPFFTSSVGRSAVLAENDSGTWDNVSRADLGGLRVAINEHEVETPIKALQTFSTNQANVPDTGAVQLVTSPLANRKTVIVKNLSSSSKVIYIGTSSAVTASTGYELAAGEGIELDLEPGGTGIWAISATGTMRATWLQIGGT